MRVAATGGADALGRLADVEQRLVHSACRREVLDRRSDEAYGGGVAIGFGHVIHGGTEAAFEIHRDRKIGRVNEGARVREHLVAGDLTAAWPVAESDYRSCCVLPSDAAGC